MKDKLQLIRVIAMKQITNKEYEEGQKYKAEKAKGHILLPYGSSDRILLYPAMERQTAGNLSRIG